MTPRELRDAYGRGDNITELMRSAEESNANSEEIIEMAYDLQAGSYIEALGREEVLNHKTRYGGAIADVLTALVPQVSSVLEPGVGEGTTLSFVLNACERPPTHIHEFDIAWSRIAKCRKWLASNGQNDVFLSVASILNPPYADNSLDLVYTSHTIEPNGGNEPPILKELYRIASRYLVLLEPSFELASHEARERMSRLGYVTGLADHATSLEMKVIKHELFSDTINPLNPTAIIIIEKSLTAPPATPRLICPKHRTPLTDYDDALYSPEGLTAYPKLRGIPCLRKKDSIVASWFESFV